MFLFKPLSMGFFVLTLKSDLGENLPSQADVGVKPEEVTTAQVAAYQEFARLSKNRQQ